MVVEGLYTNYGDIVDIKKLVSIEFQVFTTESEVSNLVVTE